MNYSTYFENKVAAVLSNQFNLVTLKVKPGTDKEFLSETKLFDSMEPIWDIIDQLNPYAVILQEQVVTIKVLDHEQEKV
jgi:hypothetical protein